MGIMDYIHQRIKIKKKISIIMENKNRLQFLHCEQIFKNIDEIKSYVSEQQTYGEVPSLFAEPIIFRYADGVDVTNDSPNVVLAIGSVGDGTSNSKNRTFFIDSARIEKEVSELMKSSGDTEETVNNLTSLLKIMEKNSIVSLNDSDTVDFETVTEADSGKTFSANVKLCENGNNIIKTDKDGIFAKAELKYDNSTNTLNFENSNGSTSIKLTQNQFFVSGYYQSTTDELILIFTGTTGYSEIKIPVGSLIEEWTVDNGGHNITLIKTVGSGNVDDKLSADVNISQTEHNILKNTVDGSSLYVDGTSDNIFYNTDFPTVKSKIESLDKITSDEINRAKIAENVLDTEIDKSNTKITSISASTLTNTSNIAAEIDRATKKENELFNGIDASNSKIYSISGSINSEINRAQAQETVLKGSINENSSLITDLSNKLTDETTRAKSAENEIKTSVTELDKDVSSLSESLTGLKTSYDTFSENVPSTYETISAATEIYNTLNDKITTESSDRLKQYAALNSNINSEIVRAGLAETQLDKKIDSEINSVSASVVTEKNRAVQEEQTLYNKIDHEVIDRNNAISLETSNRTIAVNLAMTQLSGYTDSKFNDANNKIIEISGNTTSLNNTVNQVKTNVSTISADALTETSERIKTDNALQSDINKNKLSIGDNSEPTFTFSLNNTDNGRILSGKVNINGAESNIIKSTTEGGIYANSSKIEYDSTYNKITYTDNLGKISSFTLVGANTVTSGWYDSATQSIVLQLTNGTEITIPASSLVPIMTAKSSDTITLSVSKSTGNNENVISGTVNLSSADGNILTTVTTANVTGLYVPKDSVNYTYASDTGTISVASALTRSFGNISNNAKSINQISGDVTAIKEKYITGVTSTETNTISSTTSVANNSVTISQNVKISKTDQNLITEKNDGIYASNQSSSIIYTGNSQSNVSGAIDNLYSKIESSTGKTTDLSGLYKIIGETNEATAYTPDTGSSYIKNATSLKDADSKLDGAILTLSKKIPQSGRYISVSSSNESETINFTLPIESGKGENSLVFNENGSVANGDNSSVFGSGTLSTNSNEISFGQYNNSNTDTAYTSGQTVLSVGIGTSTNNRENAIEIMKNGLIYIEKYANTAKTSMERVCLQDEMYIIDCGEF